ncbi:Golgi apyrase [Coemansia sp. RSA 2559]|nr:Golgi apyrase [Coemansia sp. RSA 2559]KAJ2869373.1 Golgi apyrase [Coemansia erecta]
MQSVAHFRLPRKWRLAALALASLLTLCVVGVYYTVLDAADTLSSEQPERADDDITGDLRKYGVVIDAGSSGSRVMVYAWDDPAAAPASHAQRNRSLPIVERAADEHWAFKTSPGISSFSDRPRKVGPEHIKPLLDFALKTVPKRQVPHTPVYLLATAGMRLLPPSHQSLILDTACSFARANYDFVIPDCQESFHVVSGELEGLYGWVAVNYLMDGFGTSQQSHGFLDMGGASAQIAFEPASVAAQVHSHDLAQVTLRALDGNDKAYRVFVATFLGHGTNEARRRYVERVQQAAPAPADGADMPAVDDPCLPTGLTLPTVHGRPVVLRGTGSFADCLSATEPLLNKTICPVEPCFFAGVHGPEIDFGSQRFVGVSEYWYASHDYLGLGGVWDVRKFETQAAAFCQKPWNDVSKLAAADIAGGSSADQAAVGRLQMQCFKAAWLVNVLHNGFGVPRNEEVAKTGASSSFFESVNHVGDVEVSWTLGALLIRITQTIQPSFQAIKARTRPGIRLSDAPDLLDGDAIVDLADDALWSPADFVGIHRLIVMWALLPSTTRAVFALVLLITCGMLVALLLWVYRHREDAKQKKRHDILMQPLGRQEEADGFARTDTSAARGRGPEGDGLRRSPSMFVLEMPNSPANADNSRSISRSSSVNNLALLNRRRGGAE